MIHTLKNWKFLTPSARAERILTISKEFVSLRLCLTARIFLMSLFQIILIFVSKALCADPPYANPDKKIGKKVFFE